MKKNVFLTWEDIFSRIEYIKKKYKIDKKTKIYGVPKNGMILAGFFNAVNVPAPEDADFILDDITITDTITLGGVLVSSTGTELNYLSVLTIFATSVVPFANSILTK